MYSERTEFYWRTCTDLKLTSLYSRKLLELETMASNKYWTRHTEVAGLLPDREFAYVTEDIVRETYTNEGYFFP